MSTLEEATQKFPRDTAGLPAATATEVVELGDGDRYALRIAPVTKRIGDATVRMLAYNGSIPGPTLRVPEGAEVIVDIENEGDLEATVHWHGLRLDNRYDGTHETQEVMPIGGRYTARVAFPDPGVYWYHPHIREDYGQELGLYGNCIVVPADPDYWPPVHRELALTLDDVLIEDGQIAAFSPDETTYAAMGRFGNVLLIAGDPELALTARTGEVVRLYLTNTANTRVFKVALPGARMKLVGGDSGRVEHEQFVEDVILAPSERVVVDVCFETPGQLRLGAPDAGPDLQARATSPSPTSRPRRHSPRPSPSCVPRPSSPPSASGSCRWSTRRRTRPWPSRRRWTWASPTSARARPCCTCARCIRK